MRSVHLESQRRSPFLRSTFVWLIGVRKVITRASLRRCGRGGPLDYVAYLAELRAIERTIVFRTVAEFSLLALAALLLRGEHRCRASFACIAAVSLFAVFVVFLQD